jgi:hypothetical protein
MLPEIAFETAAVSAPPQALAGAARCARQVSTIMRVALPTICDSTHRC